MSKAKSASKIDPRKPVLVNAEKLIAQRLDELLAYEDCLADPDNVYKLHEMRIAGKRLRYTMEVFQPVYIRYTTVGAEYGATLAAVKNLQEHLGVLHDADVLVPEILEHLGRVIKFGYGRDSQDIGNGGAQGERRQKSGKNATKKQQKSADNKDGLPIVGVNRVDYAACEGLLTLCAQLRAERSARYAQLVQELQQLRDGAVFERLRALLTEACEQGKSGKVKDEREENSFVIANVASQGGTPSSLSAPSTLNSQPAVSEDSDAANRQIPQIQRAPGEPGHVAAARRRAVRAPEKGSESGQQGRQNNQRRAGGSPASSRTGNSDRAARNGTPRDPRHSRPGTNPNSGAGEGGTE